MTSLLKFAPSVTEKFTPQQISDLLDDGFVLEVEGGNREFSAVFEDEDGDIYVLIYGYQVMRNDLEVELVTYPEYNDRTIFQARVIQA